jgi:hypothetical protein
MSDLLSRMISRASGAASPVEPLRASRYEPQLPLVAPPPAEPSAVRHVVEQLAPVQVTKAREIREEDVREVSPPQSVAERPREEPAPPRPSLRPVAASGSRAPVRERERVIQSPPAPVTRIEPHEVRIDATERTSPNHTETRVAESAQPAAPTQTAAPPAPPPAAPRIDTIARDLPRSFDIEITIGHIELRMAPPPRPAAHPKPRPRAAQPRLSLDDYLRRRN